MAARPRRDQTQGGSSKIFGVQKLIKNKVNKINLNFRKWMTFSAQIKKVVKISEHLNTTLKVWNTVLIGSVTTEYLEIRENNLKPPHQNTGVLIAPFMPRNPVRFLVVTDMFGSIANKSPPSLCNRLWTLGFLGPIFFSGNENQQIIHAFKRSMFVLRIYEQSKYIHTNRTPIAPFRAY